MMRRNGLLVLVVTATMLTGSALAGDQTQLPTTQPAETLSEMGPTTQPADTPLKTELAKPPAFKVLRFDEDYSVLDDQPRESWLDLFKYMPIGDPNLRLTVGGQARVRYEYKHNEVFGSGSPQSDSYLLTRFRVHGDLNYMDIIRLFVEGKFAQAPGRDRPGPLIFRDNADLQNAFVDITPWRHDGNKLTFRVGRQELLYGRQRLISSFVWANVMRTYDGAKAMLTLTDGQGGKWQIGGWWARLVRIRETRFNPPDSRTQFYGMYAAYTGATKWGYDLYALGVEQKERTNQNGRPGVDSRVTLGARFWTKTIAPWDFEAEGAWQGGRFAGDQVSAWMAAVEGGYTFVDCTLKPRVWVGYDFASGDDDPTDGKVGTFNQLFPLGHAWFGYIDVVGRQNIHDVRTGVDFQIIKNVKAGLHIHNFWLAEKADALYNAGGAGIRRDTTGDSGRYVGAELDLVLKVKVDRHSGFLFGYSHFFPGDFIRGTGPSKEIDFVYAQYQFTF